MRTFDHLLKLLRQRLFDQGIYEALYKKTGRPLLRVLFVFGMIIISLGASMGVTNPSRAQTPNYLHTEGSALVDSNGNRVILTGINWFGLETESFAPHGLWARSLESFLDQIQELGFNTIRLPYSNELFEPSSLPNSINYDLNPDLEGLTGLEIMDKIIEGAGSRGIRVILDRHRPDSHAQSELWYTDMVDEERWISDWVMLAERYKGNDTVIGMDLHNEPHGPATWGTGDLTTDWRLAAERAGNAILAVNPDLLIIVQGVEQYEGDWYWWGGNLTGAGDYPVRLDLPDQLVYSTHVYGPGVYPQPWFSDAEFPENLPEIWESHWAYLVHENIAPVIIGEFGGRSVGEDPEGIWQRTLVSYLRDNNLSYYYWTLNPNSGDTGGLLLDDWQSIDTEKQDLLSEFQFPSIGSEVPVPESIEELPTPEPVEETPVPILIDPQTLLVKYRTANVEERSQDSKPEFVIYNSGTTAIPLSRIELFYWLEDQGDQPLIFHCDWAAIGCSNVKGSFDAKEDGEKYLRINFGPAAGVIEQGQESGEIKIRFNRNDWSPLEQSDDYSFSPVTEYAEWDRVTLNVDGQRVWGQEPGSETDLAPVNPTTMPVEPSPIPNVTADELLQQETSNEEPVEQTTPTTIAADKPDEQSSIDPTPVEPNNVPTSPETISAVWVAFAVGAVVILVGLGIVIGLLLGRGKS